MKPNIPQDQLMNALNWRYATKQFDASKKLSQGEWAALEQALILSPSSYGLQPYRFQVVTNDAVRATLREKSWNQPQITDCSHLVVFTALNAMDEAYIEKFVQEVTQARSLPADALNEYKQMMLGSLTSPGTEARVPEWSARQAYIALGNLLTCAGLLGIDACPMEGISPADYDAVLGLEATPYRTVVVAALGHRSEQDGLASARKVRRPKDMLIQYRQ